MKISSSPGQKFRRHTPRLRLHDGQQRASVRSRCLHTPGRLRDSPGGSAEPHSFKCGGGAQLLRIPVSPGTSALNNSAAESDGDAAAQQRSVCVAVKRAGTRRSQDLDLFLRRFVLLLAKSSGTALARSGTSEAAVISLDPQSTVL